MPDPLPDPFALIPPTSTESGRLVTAGHLAPDWACRWCRQPLHTTRVGVLVCCRCDLMEWR